MKHFAIYIKWNFICLCFYVLFSILEYTHKTLFRFIEIIIQIEIRKQWEVNVE